MSEGFDNLGHMFQGSRSACMPQESRLIDDLSSVDSDGSEVEEPAAKKPKSDEAGQSTENKLILGQLEKDFLKHVKAWLISSTDDRKDKTVFDL